MILILFLYTTAMLGLALFGAQSLFLVGLFLFQRRRATPTPPPLSEWPTVTVQLPFYNELHVAPRLIDAACALQYPAERLSIQVLDDSTDETARLVRDRVLHHQRLGVNIQLLHRKQRTGFKAGALAAGMASAPGQFMAIFDADFMPPRDFLQRLLPHFADPQVGLVQARWGHLNAEYSWLTRAQALALDGHFVVEQHARSRADLLFNFNGSAGILRRACIESAGGWQSDTLSEDLDLSYRAQLHGWRLAYAPEVIAPAEIPPQIAGFKRQQYRWARGCIQTLRKLGGALYQAPLTLAQRFWGYVHLTSYLAYPLMLLALLCSLPIAATGTPLPGWLSWLSLVSFGPPLLYFVAQWAAYADWPKRFAFFPMLLGVGMGVALNNTCAIIEALRNTPMDFARTPKFGLAAQAGRWHTSGYALKLEWTVVGELLLAAYGAVALYFAWDNAPALVPLLVLLTWGFGLVGGLGLWQAWFGRAFSEAANLRDEEAQVL